MAESYLVWLNFNMNENNKDCCKHFEEICEVINHVNIFTDVDQCMDFLINIKKAMIFVIISEEFGSKVISIVENLSHINSIFIYCENLAEHKEWTEEYSKVKGIYTNMTSIFHVLKETIEDFDLYSIPISFIKITDEHKTPPKLDELDSSFMYTQIIKEILLSIDFKKEHMEEFVTYCRQPFDTNPVSIESVEKFAKEYRNHQAIWWYTSPSFLYGMLNRALRLMEVDLIIKMAFFIRDLHTEITSIHTEQCDDFDDSTLFTVYRGQGMSEKDFNRMKNTQGGLISFNHFLSTSLERSVAFVLADSSIQNHGLIGILFEITIKPFISSCPFANLTDISYFEEEQEILFSMHSIFRIQSMKQSEENERIWQVNLTLTDDNDLELHTLTECIRKETEGSTGWERLGQLMIKLGHFNKAEEFYRTLIKETDDENEKGNLFHILGCIKNELGEYNEAVRYCEQSIEINQKISPSNSLNLATSYNTLGTIYKSINEYSKALFFYEKVIEIRQRNLPENHNHLSISYNNIAGVYDNIGEYFKAILYYNKTLEIEEANLPANHPSLATSYNNIAVLYKNIGEYCKALSYHEKALRIEEKTLPVDHPDFTQSYNNIAGVYYKIGEYSKALSYYQRAIEIEQKTVNNPSHIATFHNNIGSIYDTVGEYSKAILSFEKVLEILQMNLPENPVYLANTYNNIASVYNNMRKYKKAFSYYERAIEIFTKNLSVNHPDLATVYNNIASVYDKMGKHSKAVSYYEQALEIFTQILPDDHPNLGACYNNIGLVYDNINEYSKALSNYEKAIEIFKKRFPTKHPELATSYNNIGWIYTSTNDYLKALSYFQQALDIFQSSLPSNHPNIQHVINSIEIIKSQL
ncbi:unnamed protein product [Adineta ricciae]|uniref:NAD(P)(+)--arginine ADP-ribosyltransferase n=2 Tax=Adineta ricciae TaxID=249248 RepID=A0A815VC93_ADIRI|nr:unnamed protein product [Adineta ricciae]